MRAGSKHIVMSGLRDGKGRGIVSLCDGLLSCMSICSASAWLGVRVWMRADDVCDAPSLVYSDYERAKHRLKLRKAPGFDAVPAEGNFCVVGCGRRRDGHPPLLRPDRRQAGPLDQHRWLGQLALAWHPEAAPVGGACGQLALAVLV